jgi:hypothetical protein
MSADLSPVTSFHYFGADAGQPLSFWREKAGSILVIRTGCCGPRAVGPGKRSVVIGWQGPRYVDSRIAPEISRVALPTTDPKR